MEKRCPDCGETKPAAEFGRNRTLKDGLSFYCLACNRARNSAWYRRHRASLGKEVRDHSWVPAGFRWCPSCQQAVSEDDYVRNSRTASGFGSRCRPCDRTANSEAYFYRTHKITIRALAELRAAQNDACAVCGQPGPEHLDHDHDSGVIRQLLCQRCNQGLGLFRDEPSYLRAAADYVEEHRRRERAKRPRPLSARRVEVVGRPPTAPVGSRSRPGIPPARMCSRGRAYLAAREGG